MAQILIAVSPQIHCDAGERQKQDICKKIKMTYFKNKEDRVQLLPLRFVP